VSRKLERELAIMERVVDQMLLDSRNFLVGATRGNTHGLYLEGYGVLLAFEASLLNKQDDTIFDWEDFEIKDDGDVIIIRPRDGKKEGDEKKKDRGKSDPEAGESDSDEGTVLRKSWRTRNRDREERLYNMGKDEIRDLLVDYGDSMSSLGDNQWLAIAAFLGNNLPFIEDEATRLVVKARMSDLRAYGANRITRDTMLSRIVYEEY
jgi:hypothetical protein